MQPVRDDAATNLTQVILGNNSNNNDNDSNNYNDDDDERNTSAMHADTMTTTTAHELCDDDFFPVFSAAVADDDDDDNDVACTTSARVRTCHTATDARATATTQSLTTAMPSSQHMALLSQHGARATPYAAVAMPATTASPSPRHRDSSSSSSSSSCHDDDNNSEDENEEDVRPCRCRTNTRTSDDGSTLTCEQQQQQQQMQQQQQLQQPPARATSLVALHSARYGAFLRAYLGLTSDSEVARACRRARTMCAIGVRKLRTRLAASSSNSSNSSSSSHGAAAVTVVRTTQSFRRHSVLAVEGDAMFAEMLLYARAVRAHGVTRRASVLRTATAMAEDNATTTTTATATAPNARCIALHYGLPRGHDGGVCTRATLMAVVCSTRVAAHTDVHVCLASYARCLDEATWHRRHYGRNNDISDDVTACADEDDDVVYSGVRSFALWPRDVTYYHGVGARHVVRAATTSSSSSSSSADIAAAASTTTRAQASFPFTLVDLVPTPELGDGQLGIVATRVVPYATCFLYAGPTWSTSALERIRAAQAQRQQQQQQQQQQRQTACKATATLPTSRSRANDNKKNNNDNNNNSSNNKDDDDDEMVRAALDDTYALGLGERNVCFGQGLARYINHRYNLTRFGNCELCSLMLSVPSAPATPPTRTDARTTAMAAARRRRRRDGNNNNNSNSKRREAVKATAHDVKRRCDGSSSNSDHTAVAAARVVYSLSRQHARAREMVDDARTATAATAVAAAVRARTGTTTATATTATSSKTTTRTRRIFYEHHSHLVTLPFFLTTTDVPAGAALLAWTYGEDYDARLERVAVAQGALVPHADAVVLNRRLTTATVTTTKLSAAAAAAVVAPSWPHVKHEKADAEDDDNSSDRHRGKLDEATTTTTTAAQPMLLHDSRCCVARASLPLPWRWQRYSGDYRYAIAVGDIVWRRRCRHAIAVASCRNDSVDDGDGGRAIADSVTSRRACSTPERDLFAVVDVMRCGVEYVLLRPLQRLHMTRDERHRLLSAQLLLQQQQEEQQQQSTSSCDVAPASHVKCEAMCGRDDDKPSSKRDHANDDSSGNNDQWSRTCDAQVTARLSSWAVYVAHDTPIATAAVSASTTTTSTTTTSSSSVQVEQLRRCVVATTRSVALLLAGTDYHYVDAAAVTAVTPTTTTAPTTRRRHGKCSSSNGAGSARGLCVAVDVAKLRASTALVCCTRNNNNNDDDAQQPLSNGLLWPLFRHATAPPLSRLFA